MDFLYAISIRGTTLYVCGQLSENECTEIEAFAKQFQSSEYSLDCESTCQSFIMAVQEKFMVSLTRIPVKYVFRIK